MSFKDIKELVVTMDICDLEYKFIYDFEALSLLEERFGIKGFDTLGELVLGLDKRPMADIIDFALIGLKRNHPKADKDLMQSVESYRELIDCCQMACLQAISSPSFYNELVFQAEPAKLKEQQVKKKLKKRQPLLHYIIGFLKRS